MRCASFERGRAARAGRREVAHRLARTALEAGLTRRPTCSSAPSARSSNGGSCRLCRRARRDGRRLSAPMRSLERSRSNGRRPGSTGTSSSPSCGCDAGRARAGDAVARGGHRGVARATRRCGRRCSNLRFGASALRVLDGDRRRGAARPDGEFAVFDAVRSASPPPSGRRSSLPSACSSALPMRTPTRRMPSGKSATCFAGRPDEAAVARSIAGLAGPQSRRALALCRDRVAAGRRSARSNGSKATTGWSRSSTSRDALPPLDELAEYLAVASTSRRASISTSRCAAAPRPTGRCSAGSIR